MLRAQIMFHVHLDIFIRLSASSSSICYPFYVCLVSRKPNNSMSILNLVDLSVFIQTTFPIGETNRDKYNLGHDWKQKQSQSAGK